jgi:hypothetical protein
MAVVPQTVYARDGDVHLAYQVVSDREFECRTLQSGDRQLREQRMGIRA